MNVQFKWDQNYAIIPKTRPQNFILIKLCIELKKNKNWYILKKHFLTEGNKKLSPLSIFNLLKVLSFVVLFMCFNIIVCIQCHGHVVNFFTQIVKKMFRGYIISPILSRHNKFNITAYG